MADFGGGDGSAFGDVEDGGANWFGDGEGGVAKEFGFYIWWSATDADESGFDAVGGGAGHEAEDEERIFGHEVVVAQVNGELDES